MNSVFNMTKLPTAFWIHSLSPFLLSYHFISTAVTKVHEIEKLGNSNARVLKNRIAFLRKSQKDKLVSDRRPVAP